jgi:DNA-binding NarL/FixJ family response regulator
LIAVCRDDSWQKNQTVLVLQGAVLVKRSPHPEKSLTELNHLNDGQGSSLIRVLVVDDHEPFRRFVRATLNVRPELQIICEASDGLEAVQKAAEQQPGLIVLDIGLPSLNGIEAARRIRKLSPKSKILFLSQESSAEVMQEAISLGALGYVIKAQAARDLPAALEAVLRNERFISSTLKTADG